MKFAPSLLLALTFGSPTFFSSAAEEPSAAELLALASRAKGSVTITKTKANSTGAENLLTGGLVTYDSSGTLSSVVDETNSTFTSSVANETVIGTENVYDSMSEDDISPLPDHVDTSLNASNETAEFSLSPDDTASNPSNSTPILAPQTAPNDTAEEMQETLSADAYTQYGSFSFLLRGRRRRERKRR